MNRFSLACYSPSTSLCLPWKCNPSPHHTFIAWKIKCYNKRHGYIHSGTHVSATWYVGEDALMILVMSCSGISFVSLECLTSSMIRATLLCIRKTKIPDGAFRLPRLWAWQALLAGTPRAWPQRASIPPYSKLFSLMQSASLSFFGSGQPLSSKPASFIQMVLIIAHSRPARSSKGGRMCCPGSQIAVERGRCTGGINFVYDPSISMNPVFIILYAVGWSVPSSPSIGLQIFISLLFAIFGIWVCCGIGATERLAFFCKQGARKNVAKEMAPVLGHLRNSVLLSCRNPGSLGALTCSLPLQPHAKHSGFHQATAALCRSVHNGTAAKEIKLVYLPLRGRLEVRLAQNSHPTKLERARQIQDCTCAGSTCSLFFILEWLTTRKLPISGSLCSLCASHLCNTRSGIHKSSKWGGLTLLCFSVYGCKQCWSMLCWLFSNYTIHCGTHMDWMPMQYPDVSKRSSVSQQDLLARRSSCVHTHTHAHTHTHSKIS